MNNHKKYTNLIIYYKYSLFTTCERHFSPSQSEKKKFQKNFFHIKVKHKSRNQKTEIWLSYGHNAVDSRHQETIHQSFAEAILFKRKNRQFNIETHFCRSLYLSSHLQARNRTSRVSPKKCNSFSAAEGAPIDADSYQCSRWHEWKASAAIFCSWKLHICSCRCILAAAKCIFTNVDTDL